jgi:hypothetical protein
MGYCRGGPADRRRVLIIYGVIAPLSAGQVALAVPIGVQEMVLAVWLIRKGFDQTALSDRRVEHA